MATDIQFDGLVREEIPEGIKDRCLELCKEYLSDNWRQQTVDTISVRRITGGLDNRIYYCGISEPSIGSTVAQEVVIRLYGTENSVNSSSGGNQRLNDTITSLMVSKDNLGPKMLGIFNGGQIQQFYHVKKCIFEDEINTKLLQELSRKLARIHAMEAPLPRGQSRLKEIDRRYEEAFKRFPIYELIDKYNCKTLKENDLKVEIQWLKESVYKVKSPLVFSHNDLWSPNIMVLNKETDSGDQLVICDFEYSGYDYRGYDFGTLLGDWGRVGTEIIYELKFPSNSVIKQLLQFYIKENEIIFGESWSQNENNSMDQLLREAKVFSLLRKMMITLFWLKTDETLDNFPMNKQQLMILAEHQLINYYDLKKLLIND